MKKSSLDYFVEDFSWLLLILLFIIVKAIIKRLKAIQDSNKASDYRYELEQKKIELKNYNKEEIIQFIHEHSQSYATYFERIKTEGNHRWYKYTYDAHKVYIIETFDDDSFECRYTIKEKNDTESIEDYLGNI